ncbi:hypothetical protein AQ621_03225 [Marinobacter sp. P4B1]|nr:hypothetical protein AQ621_03225 [Marinobacter sp. P4B1]
MSNAASLQYEDTAYRGNRKSPEPIAPSGQSKLFINGWTQGGRPLAKSSRSGVFPPKALETWSPEVMVEEDNLRRQFEQEAAEGGEPYNPAGWINGGSIRYATLPRISWALLWMRHGGRFASTWLLVPFILAMLMMWFELGAKTEWSTFWWEAVFPFVGYFYLPMAMCWGIGYLVEKYFPHIIYRRPKGPKWELNRRTGMVTLYYDPDTDERAGEISAQAPFDEWDGYLVTLPDRQGNLWYRLNLVHKTEEWALPLNQLMPATTNREDVLAFWLLICRYMDVTQPLPDIPLFESFRHQDPRTVRHDEKAGRNPRYWRDMSKQEYERFKQDNRHKLHNNKW